MALNLDKEQSGAVPYKPPPPPAAAPAPAPSTAGRPPSLLPAQVTSVPPKDSDNNLQSNPDSIEPTDDSADKPHKERGIDVGDDEGNYDMSPTGSGDLGVPEGKAAVGYGALIGYGAGAAVDLHTGSIVFSDKGTLSSDTNRWLLEDGGEDGDNSSDGRRNRKCPPPCPPCDACPSAKCACASECLPCCYTSLCVSKCYSITAGVALVCLIIAIVMVVSSVPRIRAYNYVRGFQSANCTTADSYYGGEWDECDCEQRKSTFPCVKVYVAVTPIIVANDDVDKKTADDIDSFTSNSRDNLDNITTNTGSNSSNPSNNITSGSDNTTAGPNNNTSPYPIGYSSDNGSLTIDNSALSFTTIAPAAPRKAAYLLRYNEFDLIQDIKCSYKPICDCDKEVNRERVLQFMRAYDKPGTSFSCMKNPRSDSEVIRDTQMTGVAVEWIKVLLPPIAFLLCFMAVLIVWILRRKEVWYVVSEEEAKEKEPMATTGTQTTLTAIEAKEA